MKQIFQIIDEAKEVKEKIKSAFNEDKIDKVLLASWIEKTIELEEALAKKIDEITEQLQRFEQEVRKE